jgi:phosphatidylethanolamine N-methyltransferase
MDVTSILCSMAATAALPTWWNIVAQNEYKRHTMEKIFGKYPGAYVLAALIFTFSLGRDWVFQYALRENSEWKIIQENPEDAFQTKFIESAFYGGAALIAVGGFLVITSFLRLGVTGTYLGDYFGILMKARVTAFPFSHFDNPMYTGATMSFLGASLMANCVAGVFLTAWVFTVYNVSCLYFENPFTANIYAEAAKKAEKKGKKE